MLCLVKSLAPLFARLRGFSPTGFLVYIFLKIRKKEIIVSGSCAGCGACCRSLCLDDGTGWLRSEEVFRILVQQSEEYRCFEIIGYDASGYLLFRCNLLSADGRCSTYEDRFSFCRNFPDKNLLFCGGRLPEGCGYRLVPVKPFAQILEKEILQKNEKNSNP